jgi:hypothetical protein
MKKTTLIIAVLLMAWGVKTNAQLNNPKDANGEQIYRWDCANDKFATSNNFEIDETVVFAVDVTGAKDVNGVSLDAWVNATPPAGQTRSIGFDFNTQWGGGGCDGRFIKIKGNIYGCTLNFAQLITSRQNQIKLLNVGDAVPGGNAFTLGEVVTLNSNIFGFAFKSTDPGADWWEVPLQGALGANLKTAPYTGTKTSIQFYKTDTNDLNFFPGSFTDWMGYAAPCASIPTAVRNVFVSSSPVVAYEYYSILGNKLSIKPLSGMFIEKSIREDGTSSTIKVFKQLK